MLLLLSIRWGRGDGGPDDESAAGSGYFDGPVSACPQDAGAEGPVSFQYFRVRDSVDIPPAGADDNDLGSDG